MKKILLTGIGFVVLSAQVNAFETSAKYAFLTDADTGYVMLDKDSQTAMPPASMSKLMTAYIVFEAVKQGRLSMDTEFLVSSNAWEKGGVKSGSSTMFLNPNQTVKVGDLIRGVIVQSGNDACIVLAENIAGSEEAFADLMNQKAKELGLKNSYFKNSTGLPDPEHLMSSRDLAILARALINTFPEFYPIYSEKEFTYNGIKQGNRNPLLYSMNGADGLKTGHTSQSGYGLAGSVKTPDGRRLIMVLNGMESMKERAAESQKVINYGLYSFTNKVLFQKGAALEKIPVWNAKEKTIDAVLDKDFKITVPKGPQTEVKAKITYNTPLIAPVQKGQKIGTLTVEDLTSQQTYTTDIVAGQDAPALNFFGRLMNLF